MSRENEFRENLLVSGIIGKFGKILFFVGLTISSCRILGHGHGMCLLRATALRAAWLPRPAHPASLSAP
jgi:hypothetical protein